MTTEQYLEGFMRETRTALDDADYGHVRVMARQLFQHAQDLEMSEPYEDETDNE